MLRNCLLRHFDKGSITRTERAVNNVEDKAKNLKQRFDKSNIRLSPIAIDLLELARIELFVAKVAMKHFVEKINESKWKSILLLWYAVRFNCCCFVSKLQICADLDLALEDLDKACNYVWAEIDRDTNQQTVSAVKQQVG